MKFQVPAIFGGPSPAAAAEGATGPAPAPAPGPTGSTGAAATGPTGSTGAPEKTPSSSLDIFASVFDNANAKSNTADEHAVPTVGDILTPEVLTQASSKINFQDFITEETKQALAAGEDPNAVFNAFNEVAAGAYRQSLQHSAQLSEQLLEAKLAELKANLHTDIQSNLVQNAIHADAAAQENPVIAASIKIMADKLQSTFPDATPDWINSQAKNWFTEISTALGGSTKIEPGTTGPTSKPKETIDWMEFATANESKET